MLEPVTLKLKSFILAGTMGTTLHVLFDSPLYTDIRLFYPLTRNPLCNPVLSPEVYSVCVWLGIIGIIYYAGLVVFLIYKRQSKQ